MKKNKAYSQDNLIEDELEPIIIQAGPSTMPDPVLPPTSAAACTCKKVLPSSSVLHHSLILSRSKESRTENNDLVNRCIKKSHSIHNFPVKKRRRFLEKSHSTYNFSVPDEKLLDRDVWLVLQHTLSLDDLLEECCEDYNEIRFYCDTNKRQNERYPEVNDVDNLDYEIMDALTLETGNLPDLTEEQSSSIDESTRRDDFWSETLSAENLNYLNRILCLDQEGAEGHSLEAEWEASGEGCEHLHLVLKYWNFLVLPYPELRQAVSWGQVRCYCPTCQPDAQPPLAG